MKLALLTIPGILVALVFSLPLIRQGTASSQPGIGYVSPKRIVAGSADARAEASKFQAAAKQTAADLNAKRQALETTRQEIAKTTDTAARAALQQREREQRADVERGTAEAQRQLQSSQRELVGDLNVLLKPVLDQIVKERNIQVVLNADTGLVWAAPSLDLTSEVIARLNAKSSATPPKN
jgi:outer membrane protein